MPQSNRIKVHVYPKDSEDIIEFDEVNYISFIAFNTYGIPAVIGEEKYKAEGLPLRVLYINPANVAAVDAERTA